MPESNFTVSLFVRRNRAYLALLNVAALLAAFLFVDLPIATPKVEAVSSTVVISEFRTRGPNGGSDEFVELYNLSAAPVSISGWKINASNAAGTTGTRLTIAAGVTLNPGCYYLVTNSSTSGGPYSGSVPGNQTYATGITDDGGLAVLTASDVIVDQIGMSAGSTYKEGTTLAPLTTNVDRGYERRPGGASGNGTDTDNNSSDFQLLTPSNPQTGCSGPTPTPTPPPTPTPDPTPTVTPSPTPPPPTSNLVINELDSDTLASPDASEFVEIYDGGAGNTPLNGLTVVFYNGSNDLSYRALDLTGMTTDAQGYFTIGNAGVAGVDLTFPNDTLQNGADAVALYAASVTSFPNNTPVTTANLVDAIVYDTADADDPGLLPLLSAGQGQVDESSTGDSPAVSNQRCPNGEGGQRNTSTYLQRTPTPGAANNCPAPPVFKKIAEIQGALGVSPYAGLAVITEGIVTAKKTNGFFLQEPDATADGNDATSEGTFVFTAAAPNANVGDFVNVTGTATEFFNLTQISTSNANVVVSTTGNSLPSAVELTTTILNPNGPVDQLERFEGMRLSAASVVSVAPTNDFGEIFTVLAGVNRPLREPGIDITQTVPPDPTSGVADCCIPRWDRNPERIMIDSDGLAGSSVVEVTSKVTLNNIIGPLDFSFSNYKITPEVTPVVASPNMTAVPAAVATGSEFSVAGYNIENFAGGTTQAQKASLAIRNVMNLPDVIGTIEISTQANLQLLADRVNADVVAVGGVDPQYQAYLIPAPAGGTQNVGFLVKRSRVRVDSVVQEQGDLMWIPPGLAAPDHLHDRPPLVLRATVNPDTDPRPIIAVVNHLRSFIDVEALNATGVRVREKRKRQAEATAGLLQQLQTDNAGVPVISVGDYNAYQFSDGFTDPIATIKGFATEDDKVVVDASPDLVTPNFVNLVDSLPALEQYSFIFEGTPQALDHIIVNGAANAILKSFTIARMNADFNRDLLAGNGTTPLGNSDHDTPVAIFQFPKRATTTSVSDVTVTYNVSGQSVQLNAEVSTAPNTVNEGTVTFTITDANGTVVGTAGPASVTGGAASATFALPGSVLPQGLTITAEFSGGDTTLASTGTGTLTVKYAVCVLYDESRAVRSGATFPIKLQLCDVNGVNVSSPDIQVRALNIIQVSSDTTSDVVDAGNANPDNNFRYEAALAGYIFNLKTTGLSSGVYRLTFAAGSDSTVHSVEFRVK